LTEALNFIYSTEKEPVGGYTHFEPTEKDILLKKEYLREHRKKQQPRIKEVSMDLFTED
jgi:hypothetical protein